MTSECGIGIAKYALCIFNFLFSILGTIVLGAGIWLAVDKSSLIALLKLVDSEHLNHFTEPALIQDMGYLLIIIGGVMFLLSFLGYCGAIRESRCLLSTYATFMILLLIAEIVAGGLAAFYKEQVRNETQTFLQSTVSIYYSGGNTLAQQRAQGAQDFNITTPYPSANGGHTDAVTHMWNKIMSTFACCGVTDYHDFERSAPWRTYRGNRTVPEACCMLKDVAKLVPRDETCVTNPTEQNSFYKQNCYDKFSDWLITNREIIIGILIGVGVVHLLAIFVAIVLAKAFAKYRGMRL